MCLEVDDQQRPRMLRGTFGGKQGAPRELSVTEHQRGIGVTDVPLRALAVLVGRCLSQWIARRDRTVFRAAAERAPAAAVEAQLQRHIEGRAIDSGLTA